MAHELELTLMLADYHRTRPLLSGEVTVDRGKFKLQRAEPGEACMRPVYEEFDIAEMSLSWYMMARCRNEPVIALPIFPLRMQIHPYIFCGTASGIEGPEDLKGKKIGMDEYRLTVGLWARGSLREYSGVRRKNASGLRRRPNGRAINRPRASTLRLWTSPRKRSCCAAKSTRSFRPTSCHRSERRIRVSAACSRTREPPSTNISAKRKSFRSPILSLSGNRSSTNIPGWSQAS